MIEISNHTTQRIICDSDDPLWTKVSVKSTQFPGEYSWNRTRVVEIKDNKVIIQSDMSRALEIDSKVILLFIDDCTFSYDKKTQLYPFSTQPYSEIV